jgi:hypothetical protein
MPTSEPPTTVRPAVSPVTGPADEESPAAPAIPSFASLRGPRGRSAVDLLLQGAAPGPSAPRPSAPRPSAPRPGPAPRPAEYADLVRFGIHLARVTAVMPLRMAGWAVREPRACLRRVLGGPVR